MAIHSQYVTGRKEVTIYVFYVFLVAHIWGPYNLCSSVPIERLTVSPSSAYVLSLLMADVQAFLPEAGIFLCTVINSVPTPTLASAYSLSTAAP